MNIDENITIFKIPPQVDKDLKVHYAKWHKPPFKVVILSTYNCTQAKVDKQNFHICK
jgi:predicted nuclease of predicted toxin-antitoxin system